MALDGDHTTAAIGWFGYDQTDMRGAFRDDPYTPLNHIRNHQPVHVTPLGALRLFRYRDVMRLLRETKVGMRTLDGVLPGVDEEALGPRRFMLFQDPPDHTRLRRLVSSAFTPPAIAAMKPHVEALVDSLLDRVEAKGHMDVIADLARPLPATVICQMLGVPLADRELFTDWTAAVTHLLVPEFSTAQAREQGVEAAGELGAYMTSLLDERRTGLGDDLLSRLIRAEVEGDRLSSEEVLIQALGLLVAGFETTIGLIGNGIRQLLLHPAQLTLLRQRPELIDSAVDECLRFDGPIIATLRVLHESAEFDGHRFPVNTPVVVSLAAAQRDPEVYPNPDAFLIDRRQGPHLGFGGGIHYCLGAHLARMEARSAIGAVVRRFPRLELANDQLAWGQSLFRILAQLPVRI